MLYDGILMTFVFVQPVRWRKCQFYCVQSLYQAGIWSAGNIISENIISLPGWYLMCREYHFRKYYFSSRLVIDLQRISFHKILFLCQAAIWSAEKRSNLEGAIQRVSKNPMRLSSLIWKTHKTAEASWADTFRVCKSTAFLAVLNKGILVESWKIWFSDQLKEETDPWRTLKTDPTRIKLKLAGRTRIPGFLSTSEKWKST